jgi:hypothetical protein
MTYNEYLDEFKRILENAIEDHEPHADQSLQQGSLLRFKSFITDYEHKLLQLNDVLVAKGNRLLELAGSDNSIDTKKLKDEIFELGKEAINRFMIDYKPR